MRALWAVVLLAGCSGKILGSRAEVPDAGGVLAVCPTQLSAGHVPLHRLSNTEYDNTVRDLLGTRSTPAASFPADTIGANGFTNDSSALITFDQEVAALYGASVSLAAEVLASKGADGGAYARLCPCGAGVTSSSAPACAQTTLSTLASRAFRRPATPDEVNRLIGVFGQSGNFDTGLGDAIASILMNPKFLFVSLAPPSGTSAGAEFALDDYQLASRLSYFLWQSMPDDELLQWAQGDTLHTPAVLGAQVKRMLADPKVAGTLTTWRDEYAGLAILSGTSINGLDDTLRLSMIGETDRFLQDLVATDQGFLSVLTGQTSYVNGLLAAQYGIPFPGTDPNAFVRVALPAGQRTGLVTQASILTATAGALDVTHPVKRGKWVTGHLLCSQPAPPPPNVPLLTASPPDGGTIRDALNAHAANPFCNSCHQVMDPVGLSMENYDTQGRWRSRYASGAAIDATGQLPNGGIAFTDGVDLFQQLAGTDEAKTCFAEQITGFAVTRAFTSGDDQCLARQLGQSAGGDAAHFSDLVLGIATSPQFQRQTLEAP